jgi:hypothetical protein
MPTNYLVPSDAAAWPPEYHGLNLGARMRMYKHRAAQGRLSPALLHDIEATGMVLDPLDHKWRTAVIPALKVQCSGLFCRGAALPSPLPPSPPLSNVTGFTLHLYCWA